MIRTEASGITLNLNQDTLHVEIKAGVSEWKWAENFRPVIVTQEEVIDFSRWQEIVHETFESGVGKGIRSSYRKLDGAEDSYAFETSVWVEEMEEDCPGSSAKLFGRVHFEWIPICEKGLSVKEVRWPGCMEFDSPSQAWQTLVNEGQGLLIPNTWENEAGALSFNGRFLTAGGLYALVRPGEGSGRLYCDCRHTLECGRVAGASGGRPVYPYRDMVGAEPWENGLQALHGIHICPGLRL